MRHEMHDVNRWKKSHDKRLFGRYRRRWGNIKTDLNAISCKNWMYIVAQDGEQA